MIYQYDTTYRPSDDAIFSKIFSSGTIANGRYQDLLCDEIKKVTGCKYAFLTSSGTAALHLALLSINTSPNHEIILPSYLCQEVLNSIVYTGAKPIFADINSNNYSLNALNVKNKISSSTNAIIVPYMYGDIISLDELKSHGIPIIEDLAHCFGGSINRQKLGSIGKIGMTSFGDRKFVDGGFGGAIFTNDSNISEKIKSLLSPSTTDYKINYNYSIPNILSAIIYEKISLIDKHIANRKQIAKKYIEKLSQISGINVRYKSNQDSFFHRFIIDVDSDKKIFIKNMADRGVVCGIGVDYPLHIMYKQNYDLPNTKTASKKGVALPIRPNLTDEEIELITDAVKNILK